MCLFKKKYPVRFREWGVRHSFVNNAPLTDYEPNVIDNYHISETTEIFIQVSSSDSRPSNLHNLEIDDYTFGRALSSPLFTQEREDPASRRQAYHSLEEGLLSSQSLSVGHVRTGRPVSDELGSLISNVREYPCRDSENEQIRILLERQKEQILAECSAEIQRHEFPGRLQQKRSIQKVEWNDRVAKKEICRANQGDEHRRRDHQLLHEQLLKQNRELRESQEKSLNGMEELKRFQGSTFDSFSRRKLIEDRDTILELTAKIQELQNEFNCMNDSRDFQDAESVCSGHSHVTSQPVSFPPHPVPGGMLSRSLTEIQKHEFQANSDRRSIQELNGIIGSQRREIDHTLAGDEQLRRNQLLLREQLSEQNQDLREAHMKILYEMEELKRVQGSRVDEFSRRRLTENQDTIHELTAKIQEVQNEVNCVNDSRLRRCWISTQWTFPRYQSTSVFPPF